MNNPYLGYIDAMISANKLGAAITPRGAVAATPVTAGRSGAVVSARKVMIFSPHPDDECIIGGLPYRLRLEHGWRVINVGVTLGSKRERQAERADELRAACAFLGFELTIPGPVGLERINAAARREHPAAWSASVAAIGALLQQEKPEAILFPHFEDQNSTHVGVHLLVKDALSLHVPGLKCVCFETEFWAPMRQPTVCCEISPVALADLVAALALHQGEVMRNPYHLRIAPWMQDNVRRGAELIGGQGGVAPQFLFATLYGLGLWSGGVYQTLSRQDFIGEQDSVEALVDTCLKA